MKMTLKALCISVIFTIAFTTPVAAGEADASKLEISKGAPTYSNIARFSDDGMERDHIYTFADGEINPEYGEPILMVNGTFYAGTPVIRKYSDLYVPLRAVAEALGADVSWGEEDNTLTIQYHSLEIEIKKGPYQAYEVFKSNKEGRQGYLEPLIVDDIFYVDVIFIAHYFDLDMGYVIGGDTSLGYEIALNPVIWLDSPITQNLYEKASTDEFHKLKYWLTECLENGKKEFSATEHEERFELEIPRITNDIENMKYIGQAGRYALYKCSYIILVDMHTHDVYIHKRGNGYEVLFKADSDGHNLFNSIYLAE